MDTEIYIGNTAVDLYDDFPMSLNYAIADIVHPEKRNANFSKTIKIPGSKKNDALFGYIFNISKESQSTNTLINFVPDFNPNLKADCVIYEKTLLQFKGYAQLLQVNQVKGKREYEIAVYGNIANIFTEIENIKLSDLDFSEFDHAFNKTNQKESWDTRIQKNGANYVNFSGGAPTGEGYVYPIIDYGYRQDLNYEVLHLYPAIYLKQYIDKIFEAAGFSYTCAFFQTEFFRRLIVPFSSELVNLSTTEVENRKFKAGLTSDLVYNVSVEDHRTTTIWTPGFSTSPILFNNDSTGGNFDNTNQYNIVTGQYVVGKSGYYDLNAFYTVNFALTPPPGTAGTGFQFIQFQSSFNKKNGTLYSSIQGGTGILYYGSNMLGDHVIQAKATNVYLQKGDVVESRISANIIFTTFGDSSGNPVSGVGTFVTTIKASGATFFNAPVVSPVLEGDTMLINSTLPKEIGAKDLFQSVITAFNLYVDIDPDNERNLIIEPAKDFYANNSIVDWTDKLDVSKEMWIRPVSEIEGKNYKFSYKSDSDYWNQKYQDVWESTYGEQDLLVRNDFVKGIKEIGLIFSPSPSVGNFANNMIVPSLIKINDDLTKSPATGNIRLLYYGGVKSAGGSWTYFSSSGNSTETTYSYAGHLDDPANPTVDLNFGVPEQLYYSASLYTNNNLYNIYWKQFIEEITDRDSKLITAYFRLRPIDIFQLSFKNFIHVDGINFRLNRILDYDPRLQDSFKVELSKIKRGVPFTPVSIEVPQVPAAGSIIEGGKDEVRSLSATSPIYILEGGLDAVINLGSANSIQIVNGGKD
jgi:hypothetical protein